MSIRIGIIGCGAVAEAMHLPAAVNEPGFRIVSLIDPNTERTSVLQKRFGTPQTAENLNEVADDLDAVIICTPPHLHLKVAEDAFSLGLHVLCEKPMANTVAECEKIIAAADKAKRVLAMAHIFRFYPSLIPEDYTSHSSPVRYLPPTGQAGQTPGFGKKGRFFKGLNWSKSSSGFNSNTLEMLFKFNLLNIKKKISSPIALSLALLIVFFSMQFLILFNFIRSQNIQYEHFSGDEPYYVGKALYLLDHGAFPKAGIFPKYKDNKEGRLIEGYNDFRPPGYPVFVSLCKAICPKGLPLRFVCATIQFAFISILLLTLHIIACVILKESSILYLFAVTLGIQPWIFEYTGSILPDSLTTSVVFVALIYLVIFIVSRKNSVVFLILSTLFLSISFMLRPEMIVFVPIFSLVAILIKTRNLMSCSKYALFSGLVFFIFVGLNISYRIHFDGKPAIFGKFKTSYHGALSWLSTCFFTELSATR